MVETSAAGVSERGQGAAARSFSSSGPAASARNCSWVSPPTWTSATSVNPASQKGRTASTTASRSGPQGMLSATSSRRTNWVAPAKPAVVGRSALTDQPPANQRNWSCARSTAASSSGSQQIGIWPMARAGLPMVGAPSVSFHFWTTSLERLDRDHVVGERRQGLHRPVAGDRDRDPDGVVGQVPDPGRVDLEVLTPVVDQVAGVQLPDDPDGLDAASPRAAAGPASHDRRRAR